jgi:LydA holin phage, holin superfamily III
MIDWLKSLSPDFVAIAAAFLGAFAKLAHDISEGQPFVLVRALARLVVSAFAALLFYQLAVAMHVGPNWNALICGVGSFMGIEAINLVQAWVIRKIVTPRARRD